MINKSNHIHQSLFRRILMGLLGAILLIAEAVGCKKTEPIEEYTVESPKSKVPESAVVLLDNDGSSLTDRKCGYYTDASSAEADFKKYGYPDSAVKTYSADWFRKFNLASVILLTNPSYGYLITDAEVSEKAIRIDVQEIKPPAATDLGQYKAFLVGIPKDKAPGEAVVTVNVESVADKR